MDHAFKFLSNILYRPLRRPTDDVQQCCRKLLVAFTPIVITIPLVQDVMATIETNIHNVPFLVIDIAVLIIVWMCWFTAKRSGEVHNFQVHIIVALLELYGFVVTFMAYHRNLVMVFFASLVLTRMTFTDARRSPHTVVDFLGIVINLYNNFAVRNNLYQLVWSGPEQVVWYHDIFFNISMATLIAVCVYILHYQISEHNSFLLSAQQTVLLAKMTGRRLSVYDTASAAALIKDYGSAVATDMTSAELLETLQQIVENMNRYRPFLPQGVLAVNEEDIESQYDKISHAEIQSLMTPRNNRTGSALFGSTAGGGNNGGGVAVDVIAAHTSDLSASLLARAYHENSPTTRSPQKSPAHQAASTSNAKAMTATFKLPPHLSSAVEETFASGSGEEGGGVSNFSGLGVPPVGSPSAAVSEEARIVRLREMGFKSFSASFLFVSRSDPNSQYSTHKEVNDFVSTVLNIIAEFDGIVVQMNAFQICASWNAFRPCPSHELQACHAAMALNEALADSVASNSPIAIVAGTGRVQVGFLGNTVTKTTCVVGEVVQALPVLAELCVVTGSKVLITDVMAGKVRSAYIGIPVDVVEVFPKKSFSVFEPVRVDPTAQGTTAMTEALDIFTTGFSQLSWMQPATAIETLKKVSTSIEAKAATLANSSGMTNDESFLSQFLNGDSLCEKLQYHSERLIHICKHLQGSTSHSSKSIHKAGAAATEGGAPPPSYYARTFIGWDALHTSAASAFNSFPSVANSVEDSFGLIPVVKAHSQTETPRLFSLAVKIEPNSNDSNHHQVSTSHPSQKSHALGTSYSSNGSTNHHLATPNVRLGLMRKQSSSSMISPTDDLREKLEQRRLAPSLSGTFSQHEGSVEFHAGNSEFDQAPEDNVVTEVTTQIRYQPSDKVLGVGATAEVRLGMQVDDGSLVAMKFVKIPNDDDGASSPTTARRRRQKVKNVVDEVLKEVQLMAPFRHDNIVSYLGASVQGGCIVILTEYVSGGSLSSTMHTFGGKLPLPSVKRYLKDILHGLHYLHSNDIAHRDVKPHNVLLMIDGQCKLSDFGASSVVLNGGKGEGDNVTGTPLYMAPEACLGRVCKESDIWSLGIMTHELLTGSLPYTEEQLGTPFMAALFIFKLGRDDTGVMAPHLSQEVVGQAKDFIVRCTGRDPATRPTAAELLMHPFLLG